MFMLIVMLRMMFKVEGPVESAESFKLPVLFLIDSTLHYVAGMASINVNYRIADWVGYLEFKTANMSYSRFWMSSDDL